MKKILLSITAVSALAAATAIPAAASAQSFDHRLDRLERRIDRGLRSGSLSRGEAYRLHAQLRETAHLEHRYRRGGLTGWERADLDRRFDRISAQIRFERYDRDYGSGYGHGHDRDYRDDYRPRW